MKRESHLFEYAVIRVVPHVEREEFVNVGVILYCSPKRYLSTRIHLNEARILALCSAIDLSNVAEQVSAFERVCRGGADGGPIGKLTLPERFRWLTSARSTVLQTSKVHPGLCLDPEETLQKLFDQLVK